MHSRLGRILLTLTFLLAGPGAAAGIFDDPENLEVLPEDISSQELRATMRGFSQGLGVRCSFCHEGREGEPLDTYDFASDTEDHKLVAREMLRMVQAINGDFIAEMDPPTDDEVSVSCVTCHRGQMSPKMISDHLDDALADDGRRGMVRRYEELREQFYGGFTFDFSELNLLSYAESLSARGESRAAMAIVEANLEHHPESEWTLLSLAQLLAGQGDVDEAIERLDQVLNINPRNQHASDLRDRLRGN